MGGVDHVQLSGGGPRNPRGGHQPGHVELLLAMLSLCDLQALIELRHPDLTVGQHGLPAHHDQQRHHDHDDR
jgi:hypothetical protein